MYKRVLLVGVVILAVSSVTSAESFWEQLLNSVFRSGAGPTVTRTRSGVFTQPQVTGSAKQYATASSAGGTSGAWQMAGAAGTQENNPGAQTQSLYGGLGQSVFQSGPGSAGAGQWGGVDLDQMLPTPYGPALQLQSIEGFQSAKVAGDAGAQISVFQQATVQTQQVQQQQQ
ncbi:MAG: hypothetical protein JW741_27025 [Sedimentisphaerales bacterium]|nr:hypothetical protein [Sedimentisphaerales bacterium]